MIEINLTLGASTKGTYIGNENLVIFTEIS